MNEVTPVTKLDTDAVAEVLMLGMQIDMYELIKRAEIEIMRAALGSTRGNVAAAARLLKINRTTLHERMRAHGL